MTELERAIAKAMRAAGYGGGPEVYARPLGDGFELCVQPALEDADDDRVVVDGFPVGGVVLAPTREISVLGRVEPGPVLEIRLRAQS